MAKKKPPEAVSGTYTAIPHRVLDSHAFMGASHIARSLLFDLVRQHNGRNNGHIQATNAWLKQRGWASVDVIFKARNELVERGLIVLAKQGGRNIGASLYALTWLAISDFTGLDLRRDQFHQGLWTRLDSEPLTKKRGTRSVPRNSTVLSHGTASYCAAPSDGTNPAPFGAFTIPPDGKDVLPMCPPPTSIPGRRTKRAIVGTPRRKTDGHDTQH